MVVVYHASHYLAVYRGVPALPRLSGLGLYGVSIFFAISGYLMATLVRRTSPFVFMAHRLVRIYPTFFIVVALYGAISALLSRPFVLDWVGLTLVPAGPRIYALDVEWTLLFEVSFYVALFLLSVAGWTARLERAAAAWLGLILFGALAFPAWQGDLTPPIERLPLLEACTGFAAGLLVPAALRSGRVPRWSAPAGVVAALVLIFLDLGHDRLIAGLLAAVIVAGAIRIDRGLPGAPVNPLKTLGDWSYALYLCHVPTIRLAYELAPAGTNAAALWLFAVAACLAASAAIGSLDVWLYRRSKRFVDRCAGKAAAARDRGLCRALRDGRGLWLDRHRGESAAGGAGAGDPRPHSGGVAPQCRRGARGDRSRGAEGPGHASRRGERGPAAGERHSRRARMARRPWRAGPGPLGRRLPRRRADRRGAALAATAGCGARARARRHRRRADRVRPRNAAGALRRWRRGRHPRPRPGRRCRGAARADGDRRLSLILP